MKKEEFTIDLSKLELDRKDWRSVGEACLSALSAKIGKDKSELSLDHVYDMSDYGGDPNRYVLEISHELEDSTLLYTYVFKEQEECRLIFHVQGVI